MYAFAQHPDTVAVHDEPLYAHFLRCTNVERPYTDLVLKSQNPDGDAVMAALSSASLDRASRGGITFVKHIAKQVRGLSEATRSKMFENSPNVVHILLIRDPYFILRSFHEVVGDKTDIGETAFVDLMQIYTELRTATGKEPCVVLSQELQNNPSAILRGVCLNIGIEFSEKMLSWEAGPKPYDGVWAPWWYARTHKATGFEKATKVSYPPFPPALRQVLNECMPFYNFLKDKRIRPCAKVQTSHLSCAVKVQTSPEKATANTNAVSASGTHNYENIAENENVLVAVRDGLTLEWDFCWRPNAKVSILDSAFMLGDGVWEGIRLHKGIFVFAKEHLDRLFQGAKALDIDLEISKEELLSWLYNAVDANGMHGSYHPTNPLARTRLDDVGVHVRLMVSRGLKPTPYQNPKTTIRAPLIVILPEYKEPSATVYKSGIRLFTSHVRRPQPDTVDPHINSHSKLNCILACIQANKAGYDESLMLDPHGFVATCNSTNFFIIKHCNAADTRCFQVWTSTDSFQLNGITRQNVLRVCRKAGIECCERNFTLTDVYSTDEAFVTGTFSGLIPVVEVDGRVIGTGAPGYAVDKLRELYHALVEEEVRRGR